MSYHDVDGGKRSRRILSVWRRIDEKLISVCEAVSHFTQVWLGLTSVSWERLFVVLSALNLVLVEIPKDWNRSFMLFLDCWLIGDRTLRFYQTYKENRESEFLNGKKYTEALGRCFCFGISVFSIVLDTLTGMRFPIGWFELYTASLYFSACNDLPPSESRKKWKALRKSIAATRNPVPVGV